MEYRVQIPSSRQDFGLQVQITTANNDLPRVLLHWNRQEGTAAIAGSNMHALREDQGMCCRTV